MLTLELWQVAGVCALIALGGGATYRLRKAQQRSGPNAKVKVSAREAEKVARAEQRTDQVARLTPSSQAKAGAGTDVDMSSEKLVLHALNLSAQVRTLALAWAGQSDHELAEAFTVNEGGERRAPDRLAEARHDRARTLYQRIRHDVIDVRTELVGRLGGRADALRKPGVDRMYEYQAGTEPFQDIADDLELLARSLRGE